ncbi:MAG: deoxyribodipyrimidine photo-lyase [Pseudomonadota bacterium]
MSPPSFDSALVWFRRDLRTEDHAALAEALRRARRVHCVFVFDREILDKLKNKEDRRVAFIHASLVELDSALRARGGGLIVRHAWAQTEIPRLATELKVELVLANQDYEPQAKVRDAAVAQTLKTLGIEFATYKDQAIFTGSEVLSQTGKPYTVFTPYKKAWLKRLSEDDYAVYPSHSDAQNKGHLLAPPELSASGQMPSLVQLGFAPSNLAQLKIQPGMSGAQAALADFVPRISHYQTQRDFPAIKGVSYLSVHLRFGTISIRQLLAQAVDAGALGEQTFAAGAACWLSELIWRDFYCMILDHFPHVVTRSFKPEYDAIEWEQGASAEHALSAWQNARTGYPLVDAAMRQLNQTGYMHNRLRMVVASFLCKDLGIDWRCGERYFAEQLNDFDLAANNGGWQWAASSGCDAQPYFRIFNPVTQSQRFDPSGKFIRRYLPELAALPERHIHTPWLMSSAEQATYGVRIGRDTPAPCVAHELARKRTLARYAVVKKQA